jgi:hypothetical protein
LCKSGEGKISSPLFARYFEVTDEKKEIMVIKDRTK